jgi:hypothetical protein
MHNLINQSTNAILRPAYTILPSLYIFLFRPLRKLWKAAISFVMYIKSFRPSVLPSFSYSVGRTTRLPLDGFSWNFIFEYFQKFVERIQISLKSDKNDGLLNVKTTRYLWSYLAHSFLEREMFQTNVVEEIKTHIVLFSKFFFSKIVPFIRCGKIL